MCVWGINVWGAMMDATQPVSVCVCERELLCVCESVFVCESMCVRACERERVCVCVCES